MSKTSIEWTDAVWNPARGCSRVSRGCERCYAEGVAARFSGPGQPFEGFARRSPARWTGKVELVPEKLDEPLHWRNPRRVFVNSMSDLFHERLSFADIDKVFAVMALCQHLTFQVLTKRPERMRAYLSDPGVVRRWSEITRRHPLRPSWHGGLGDTWFPRFATHIWLGVSVEDQAAADARIPILLDTPAAVRFVSYEPALGPWYPESTSGGRRPEFNCLYDDPRVDWIIVGGESGPKARPFDVAWARSVVEQCREAGVPCFVKQLGARIESDGGREDWTKWPRGTRVDDGCDPRVLLRHRAGADPAEWPEDLRVREFPMGAVGGREGR